VLDAVRILFPFWVERALLRTPAQRATQRTFHQDIKREALAS